MPNPKVGTVTPDVVTAVQNAKAGQVQYRTDKAGIIHATIGRASFEVDKLQANLSALMDALNKARPTADRKSTRLNSVTNAHLVCRLLLEKQTMILQNKT